MRVLVERNCLVAALLAIAVVAGLPPSVRSQDSEIESLKALVSEMQRQLHHALARIEQLEKEKEAGSARLGRVEKSVQAVQSAPFALNPAVGVALDATAEHRARAGGDFNFRTAELGIAASVDPFARAYAFIGAGREGVELEEAAIVTTSLPWNLTARGGRFFADFGRLPKFHRDQLPFVNFPLSVERLIGGESKADGAELSYLFPTSFFLRGTLGGYNKIGDGNERLDGTKPSAWSRFTYLGRLQTYFDLADSHSLELGASLAYTPSIRFSGALQGGHRSLSGIDLTYRYQPLASLLYEGLVLGGELLGNSERVERASGARRAEALGGYAYAEARLSREWAAGFLFDHAPSLVSPGKKTVGFSPFVTWNLSEFNRLRFQYTFLDDKVREDPAERGHQFFLQWTTLLGSHTHGFRAR
ncbi:MAG TPA: hypothetical protein VNN77_03930 [candidate division Zixibacteria bacterium]|nr:hypothetical protein [candidate division Zixibacteria bacterium]